MNKLGKVKLEGELQLYRQAFIRNQQTCWSRRYLFNHRRRWHYQTFTSSPHMTPKNMAYISLLQTRVLPFLGNAAKKDNPDARRGTSQWRSIQHVLPRRDHKRSIRPSSCQRCIFNGKYAFNKDTKTQTNTLVWLHLSRSTMRKSLKLASCWIYIVSKIIDAVVLRSC